MSDANSYNVVTYLKAAAVRTPDRAALIDQKGSIIRFAELWRILSNIASGLEQRGLAPGDRAILMIPMSIDLYTVLLAIFKMGAVAVFVDPWISKGQIANFSAFATPRAYIGIPKSHMLRLNKCLRGIPITITTGKRFGSLPATYTLEELKEGKGNEGVYPSKADDSALITFTTGSSGMPKGANRTHGLLKAQHEALSKEFPYEDSDIDLSMFPVFCLNNLATGITSVIPDIDFKKVAESDPSRLYDQLRNHGVSTATASPPLFDRLCSLSNLQPGIAFRFRRILTGGAPVSDTQLKRWLDVFQHTDIDVVYGSTEAEPVAHVPAKARVEAQQAPPRNPAGFCVGTPSSIIRTKLIKITRGKVALGDHGWKDWEVSPGDIGELLVTADHVCKDYYKNASAVEENKVVDRDDTIWHRMGDTGYFDENGCFWIAGRVHSTIFRNEQPVHPQLIEYAAQAAVPDTVRVAAVGVPDETSGERVVLAIDDMGNAETRDQVMACLKEAHLPVDSVILLMEPLPVDPRHNSKIDYARVRFMVTRKLGLAGI